VKRQFRYSVKNKRDSSFLYFQPLIGCSAIEPENNFLVHVS
jgi:hypothetical protein